MVRIGDVFGRLTVKALSPKKDKRGRRFWACTCQCGKACEIRGDSLCFGKTQSCGCLRIERHREKTAPNLCGLVITNRKVVALSDEKRKKPGQVWVVECLACGKKSTETTYHLRVNKRGCPSCTKENEHPLQSVFAHLKRAARQRDWEVSLTLEELSEIATANACHYCGEVISWPKHKASRANLDRKNSALGYSKENVVPCCWGCNTAKGNQFSYNEFMRIAPLIREIKAERTVATQ
jgi:hypothetical protein